MEASSIDFCLNNLHQQYSSMFMKRIGTVLFGVCTSFLQLLGKVFHLSYEQVSIIFNLYLQGSLLMIFGLFPFGATIYACGFEWVKIACLFATLGYFSVYAMGFRWLLRRYKNTSNIYFDLCVQDLMRLSAAWNISYRTVNLLIFVVWWLSLVCFNLIAAYLIASF